MEAIAIKFNQSNSVVDANYKYQLNLPTPYNSKDQEIALANLTLNYSWNNITTAYGNNTCSYVWTDGSTNNITFPDGFYLVSDISAYIQLQMYTNGHYLLDSTATPVYYISLESNYVYYGITLTCSAIPLTTLPSGYTNPNTITLNGNVPQLVVATTPFSTLIGFPIASYPASLSTVAYQSNSSLVPQLSPVIGCYVNCNMVNMPQFGPSPNTIYSFSPNVTYGSQILINPSEMIFYSVVSSSYSYIELSFRDQSGNALLLLDTNIMATLVIRNKSKKYIV